MPKTMSLRFSSKRRGTTNGSVSMHAQKVIMYCISFLFCFCFDCGLTSRVLHKCKINGTLVLQLNLN